MKADMDLARRIRGEVVIFSIYANKVLAHNEINKKYNELVWK